jgi:hypothetical protein
MSVYNFQLYDDFVAAAKDCGITVSCPNDGSCLYLDLPNNLNQRFWAMLWTPLNKLSLIREEKTWEQRLRTLRQNHADFHLEFCPKAADTGNYSFFPEINHKPQSQVSRNDIRVCIERILDEANFDKYVFWARLQEPAD